MCTRFLKALGCDLMWHTHWKKVCSRKSAKRESPEISRRSSQTKASHESESEEPAMSKCLRRSDPLTTTLASKQSLDHLISWSGGRQGMPAMTLTSLIL